MKVYKFGGASVKDAGGIKNLANIVSGEKDNLVIVVSAFGKTTNALEMLLKLWLEGNKEYRNHLDNIYSYHSGIAEDLFPSGNSAKSRIENSFAGLKDYLRATTAKEYDYEY